ncbi:MAG: Y-family DNA polymerase, partial [Steroidobacteraceae bacterium]
LTMVQQLAPVAPVQAAARPCTLLRQPQRIEPPARLLSGPERIESGWWDGADAQRDYYVAHGADGARLWVFHDLTRGDWYLQGLWT